MRYVILLALVISGCNPEAFDAKGKKGVDTMEADIAAPTIDDVPALYGTWKKVGYYCGSTYAAVPTRDYLVFGASDYVLQVEGSCGRKNEKRFEYEQGDGYLTITHYSDFYGCNGTSQVETRTGTYPLTRANYPYRLHSRTLELTSGVCGGGSFIDVYQKL